MSMFNVTDEDRKLALAGFTHALNGEQVMFQQHGEFLRTWASKVHEDFFNYNAARLAAIDALVSQHMHSHFPIVRLDNATAAKEAVRVHVAAYADKLGVAHGEVYNVMLANLSYIGRYVDGWLMDTAHLVAELIAANPSRSCAVVIFPNAGSLASQVQPQTSRSDCAACDLSRPIMLCLF